MKYLKCLGKPVSEISTRADSMWNKDRIHNYLGDILNACLRV